MDVHKRFYTSKMIDLFDKDTGFEIETVSHFNTQYIKKEENEDRSESSCSSEEKEMLLNNRDVNIWNQKDEKPFDTVQSMEEYSSVVIKKEEALGESDINLELKSENIPDEYFIDEEISNDNVASPEELNATCDSTHTTNCEVSSKPPKNQCERQLFNCTTCGSNFISKNGFETHTLLHMDPKKRPMLHCTMCKFITLYRSSLRSHFKVKHTKEVELELETDGTRGIVIYKCKECSYETKVLVESQKHEQAHKDHAELYRCTICISTYTTKASLKEHILQDHTDRQTFQYGDCQLTTFYKQMLKLPKLRKSLVKPESKTVKYNSNESSFKTNKPSCLKGPQMTRKRPSKRKLHQCTTCSSAYLNKHYLKEHISRHHAVPNDPPKFRCDDCEFTATNKRALNLHGWKNHSEMTSEPKTVKCQCDKCSDGTKVPSYFERHKRIHKDRSERKLYKRTTYNSTLIVKRYLKVRMLVKHGDLNNRPKFQCDDCSYTTSYKYMLALHRSKHHLKMPLTLKTAIYKCDKCSYKTKTLYHLKKHEGTHKDRSERELHKCTTCNSTFISKRYLRAHMLVKHRNPNNRPKFQCDDCTYTTSYAYILELHRSKNHLDTTRTLKTVRYKCDKCSYKTNASSHFKNHIETHKDRSERQLYTCGTCGSTHTTKGSLVNHISMQHLKPDYQLFRLNASI